VIATAGCGCAPASVVRWGVVAALVAAALVLGAVAVVLLGRRRARHAPDGAEGAPTDAHARPGGTPERRRARPELTAAILVVLAVVVATGDLSSTLSLLGLAVGAIVASVGMGVTPPRRRVGESPSDATTPTGGPERGPRP